MAAFAAAIAAEQSARLVISRPAAHAAPVVVRTIVRPSVHEPSAHKEGAIGGGGLGGGGGRGDGGLGDGAGGSAGVCPATRVQRPSKCRDGLSLIYESDLTRAATGNKGL